MKQAYLVHYYIVSYIKGKEEKYPISLGRFTCFIPRYLGSRHQNLIWVAKLPSINSSFWVGKDFVSWHCLCGLCQFESKKIIDISVRKMKSIWKEKSKFGCKVEASFGMIQYFIISVGKSLVGGLDERCLKLIFANCK